MRPRLLDRIKDAVRWLQAREPRWLSGNTWLNESIGGAVPTLVLTWWLGPTWAVLLFAVGSCAYERWLDPHGWSLDDWGQRAAGSLLVAWLWCVL